VSGLIEELCRIVDKLGLTMSYDPLRDGTRCAYCDRVAVPFHGDHHRHPVPGVDPLECRKACSPEHAGLAGEAWARRCALVPPPPRWGEDREDCTLFTEWLGARMVVVGVSRSFEARVNTREDTVLATRRTREEGKAAAEWHASATARARIEAAAAHAEQAAHYASRAEREMAADPRPRPRDLEVQALAADVLRREAVELRALLRATHLGGGRPKAAAVLVPLPGGRWLGLRSDKHGGAPTAVGGKALPGESHASCAARECEEECGQEPRDLAPLVREVVDEYDCAVFACDPPRTPAPRERFGGEGEVAAFTRAELIAGPYGAVYARAFEAYDRAARPGFRGGR
jgi:8-oxo-dGTP pyrophosphatase MutT (NUDIX family)